MGVFAFRKDSRATSARFVHSYYRPHSLRTRHRGLQKVYPQYRSGKDVPILYIDRIPIGVNGRVRGIVLHLNLYLPPPRLHHPPHRRI